MNKTVLVLFVSLTASLSALAQFEVTDPLMLAQQVLEMARQGDPAAIHALAGLGELRDSLKSAGSGLSLDKLQKLASGLNNFGYDANGLFTPLQDRIVTPDGRETLRIEQDYRKFDAVVQTTTNFKDVQKDTEGRRLDLRGQMRDTAAQAQTAVTKAEVDKLKVVVAVQGNELASLNQEHAEAVGRVLVQDVENRNDKERQQQAQIEASSAAFKAATEKVAGFLKPDTQPALIPAPAK